MGLCRDNISKDQFKIQLNIEILDVDGHKKHLLFFKICCYLSVLKCGNSVPEDFDSAIMFIKYILYHEFFFGLSDNINLLVSILIFSF